MASRTRRTVRCECGIPMAEVLAALESAGLLDCAAALGAVRVTVIPSHRDRAEFLDFRWLEALSVEATDGE